jgi:hypothetical protein
MTLGVTGIFTAIGAVIAGLIIADIWLHPAGTQAAGATIVSLEKNTGNQLIGTAA